MKRKALRVNRMRAFRAELHRAAHAAAAEADLASQLNYAPLRIGDDVRFGAKIYRVVDIYPAGHMHIPPADYARHWELEGPQ